MLPKKFRTTLIQFNQIPQKSRSFSAFFLDLKTKEKRKNQNPRFTITVSKSLDKRSTGRHLTKRIIAEAIHKNLPNVKKPLYVLLRAKKIIKKSDRINLEKEVATLLKKAKAL